MKNLEVSSRFREICFETYRISSIGPTRSIEKKIFKKVIRTVEKKFRLFSQITDFGRQRLSFCWSAQGILPFMVQTLR